MSNNISYNRTEEAPLLSPPASEVGLWGWLNKNLFASMTNFSSVAASISSIVMFVLTVALLYFGITQMWALIDFAIISAAWTDPDGIKRLACASVKQGGAFEEDWFGACWPFISAKWKLYTYGRYPASELWRVDILFVMLAVGVSWLILDAIKSRKSVGIFFIVIAIIMGIIVNQAFGENPLTRTGVWIWTSVALVMFFAPMSWRKHVGVFMLTGFPIIAFVLLTGGDLSPGIGFWSFWIALIVICMGLGHLGERGIGGEVLIAFAEMLKTIGMVLIGLGVAIFICTINFGLEHVETNDWGGLLVTLVVALTGIVASLPIGIVLALGRRSQLPLIRYLSVIYIEFWRGIPLITVLFMSSVMLPFFLPVGVEFDKLLRALIGVALFSSAYMAEVVRGGLQAIPKGQYEGAMSMGLPFWKMMRLIVLPQALVLVIPGIVNTFIGLFKDTTLVLIIGLFDLLGSVQTTFSDASWATPVQNMSGYLTAAVIFWVFCFGMSRYSMYMENELRRGHAR